MTLSGLTESGLSGRIRSPNMITPALPDVRPAPQAGCFVSRLYASCESQITLRHRAFRTLALPPSSALTKRPPDTPSFGQGHNLLLACFGDFGPAITLSLQF